MLNCVSSFSCTCLSISPTLDFVVDVLAAGKCPHCPSRSLCRRQPWTALASYTSARRTRLRLAEFACLVFVCAKRKWECLYPEVSLRCFVLSGTLLFVCFSHCSVLQFYSTNLRLSHFFFLACGVVSRHWQSSVASWNRQCGESFYHLSSLARSELIRKQNFRNHPLFSALVFVTNWQLLKSQESDMLFQVNSLRHHPQHAWSIEMILHNRVNDLQFFFKTEPELHKSIPQFQFLTRILKFQRIVLTKRWDVFPYICPVDGVAHRNIGFRLFVHRFRLAFWSIKSFEMILSGTCTQSCWKREKKINKLIDDGENAFFLAKAEFCMRCFVIQSPVWTFFPFFSHFLLPWCSADCVVPGDWRPAQHCLCIHQGHIVQSGCQEIVIVCPHPVRAN